MADSGLPPSRFGAGYTVGSPSGPPPDQRPRTGASAPAYGTSSHGPAVAVQVAPDPSTAGLNPLAVGAFVLAVILGPFVIPLTLPMAYVAQRQISGSGQGGASLAKAAVMVNFVYFAIGAALLVLYVFVVRS